MKTAVPRWFNTPPAHSFQSAAASDMILLTIEARKQACSHSSVAQWQSIRLLTGGL